MFAVFTHDFKLNQRGQRGSYSYLTLTLAGKSIICSVRADEWFAHWFHYIFANRDQKPNNVNTQHSL